MKPKHNYNKKCYSCGSDKWEKYDEHFDDSGNNIILFECKNCGRLQHEYEVFLNTHKEKQGTKGGKR